MRGGNRKETGQTQVSRSYNSHQNSHIQRLTMSVSQSFAEKGSVVTIHVLILAILYHHNSNHAITIITIISSSSESFVPYSPSQPLFGGKWTQKDMHTSRYTLDLPLHISRDPDRSEELCCYPSKHFSSSFYVSRFDLYVVIIISRNL